MPVKFLKRVNANEQEVQGGQKIPRLQGAANIPVDTYTCQRYSSNWPKKSKIDFVQKCGDGVDAASRGELGCYGPRTEARQH